MKFFLILDVIVVMILGIGNFLHSSLKTSGSANKSEDKGIFLPVVMYHSITENPQTEYQLSPEAFAEDIYYLYANGYETVTVQELFNYTEHKGTLPEKPILLTFDDGFYNNLSSALPILEEYDMQAVISLVGYYTDVTAEKDPHAENYSYLTWEDVEALQKSGRIEIGNHTYNLHSNQERAGCSIRYGEDENAYTQMLKADLEKFQNRMQEKTGLTTKIFAYPYGFVCRESIPVLKELGYICTLICREEGNYITENPECLYGLSRYNRNPEYSTEEFFSKVLQE